MFRVGTGPWEEYFCDIILKLVYKEVTFEEMVDDGRKYERTDGQRKNIDHNSFLSGELRIHVK